MAVVGLRVEKSLIIHQALIKKRTRGGRYKAGRSDIAGRSTDLELAGAELTRRLCGVSGDSIEQNPVHIA